MSSLSRSTIDRWLSRVEDPDEAPNMAQDKHGYERRPRHKTNPLRYEYKSKPSSRRSSVNRKHTINDNFQAPNVSKGRLTLPARINTGIFSNGKTSSPVRSRRTFSETNFLHKKLQQLTSPQQQDNPQSNRPSTGRPPSVRGFQRYLYQKPKSHLEAANDVKSSSSTFQKRFQPQTREQDQNSTNSQQQNSGYEDDDNHDIREVGELHEAYTNKLLLSDLTSQMECDPKREYKSLEELKAILEERMKTWDSSTEALANLESQIQKPQWRKRRLSPSVDSEPIEQPALKVRKYSHARRNSKRYPLTCRISDSHELCSELEMLTVDTSMQPASDKQSDLSRGSTLRNESPSKPAGVSMVSNPSSHATYLLNNPKEPEIVLGTAPSATDLVALNSGDREDFFAQTLDAAYNVIMNGTHDFPEAYMRGNICRVGGSDTISRTAVDHDVEVPPEQSLLLTLTEDRYPTEHHVAGYPLEAPDPQNGYSGLQLQFQESCPKQVERLDSNSIYALDIMNKDLEDDRLKGFWRRNKL